MLSLSDKVWARRREEEFTRGGRRGGFWGESWRETEGVFLCSRGEMVLGLRVGLGERGGGRGLVVCILSFHQKKKKKKGLIIEKGGGGGGEEVNHTKVTGGLVGRWVSVDGDVMINGKVGL